MLYEKVFTYLAIARFSQLGEMAFTDKQVFYTRFLFANARQVLLKYISSCDDSIYNLRFFFDNASPFWKVMRVFVDATDITTVSSAAVPSLTRTRYSFKPT